MRKIADIVFGKLLKLGEIITKKNRKNIMRYGSKYGGWYMPKTIQLDEHDICISAGAGEDISFECELAERFPCNIYIMDPTPRAIAHFNNLQEAVKKGESFKINNHQDEFYKISEKNLKRIKYFDYGLSNKNSSEKFYYPVNNEWVSCSIIADEQSEKFFVAECVTYKGLIEKLLLNYNDVKVVKMDIEGSEYEVIENMVKEGSLPDVLCFEIHKKSSRAIYSMLCLYYLIHKAGMRLYYLENQDILFMKNSELVYL